MSLKRTVEKYIEKSPARFHMPGHKGKLSEYDITELSFSDDLHKPTGVIADLQSRCAKLYSADEALLLVNGSSAGICAMLCALNLKLHRSPRILTGRDCHKSFLSGAYFSNSLVCGVYPDDETFGTVTYEAVRDALDRITEKPDAIFITSPNYYGMCADTERIYGLAKERGIYLFVDCAHGAHFPFSAELPPAPSCDAYVVSTHKTLPALNQTGILLSRCDLDLQAALSMLQTTSPSYPLMLSIEHALDTDFNKHLERIKKLRTELKKRGIKLAEAPCSAKHTDITRICILADGLAQNGYELGAKLENEGIYAEMSDLYCTVLITSPCDTDSWYERLLAALKPDKNAKATVYRQVRKNANYGYTDVRAAICARRETVELKDAVGKRAAHGLGVYPPGISCVLPGELITDEIVESLLENESCGGRLFGIENGKTDVIKIDSL